MSNPDPPSTATATLTYAEAAHYLGIGRRTLERLVAEGSVRHYRFSGRGEDQRGRVVFRRDDLDTFLESVARGGTPR